MTRIEWLDPRERLHLVGWLLSLGIAIGMAMCLPLWSQSRAFPTAPTHFELPDFVSYPLALGLVGFAFATAITRSRKALSAMFVCAGLLILSDFNRLQPWLYLYLLLFLPIGTLSRRDSAEGLRLCGFLLAVVYLWSGAFKWNAVFAQEIWPWLINSNDARLAAMWPVAPVGEMLVGLLLLVPRARWLGVVGGVVMHLALLIALGPWGHSFNSVVWPWNAVMAALLIVVFFRNPESIFDVPWRSPLAKGYLLAALLPALNFVGVWPHYVSFSLYSGRPKEAMLLIPVEAGERLPPNLRSLAVIEEGKPAISVSAWSMSIFNAPMAPEPYVYRRTAKWLSEKIDAPVEVKLY